MEVANRGEEIEAQPKTLTPITIREGKDFKHFQATHHMFASNAIPRNHAVIRLVLLRQRMPFGLFLRRACVGTAFRQPLIPTVGKTHLGRNEDGSACLPQCEVLLFAFTKGSGDNLATRFVGNYLGFLGVTLLFARVVTPLFFLGRSQGHSVASIKTTSNTVSVSRNTFLPGR